MIITSSPNKFRFTLALAMFSLLNMTAMAQSPVTVTLATDKPGAAIPDDYLGLSFEMAMVLPQDGKYYFRPTNEALLKTFKNLGIKNLRVGGNTADRPTVKFPANADIDSLFAFAKAADVKVIFTLRLREGDPKDAAAVAKYLLQNHKASITCLAIGNEPNVFTKTYPEYKDAMNKYMTLIAAPENAPDAKFSGPGSTQEKPGWSNDFATDFAPSGRIVLITQHDYSGGDGEKVSDPAAGRRQMLSADWVEKYEKLHASFAPAAKAAKLPYRIEEANNFYHGGAVNVSDTFASTLWGLDYLHWWAAHESVGLNFHTGDTVAAAERNTVCKYAVFVTSPAGYTIRPLGYAVKAFDVAGHGQTVPTKLSANADKVNLTAYGVLASDKSLYVTLINKEHDTSGRAAKITLAPDGAYTQGSIMILSAPSGDVSVTTGVTLGGSAIKEDGAWDGKWTPLDPAPAKGQFGIHLPAGTAAIVKLTAK